MLIFYHKDTRLVRRLAITFHRKKLYRFGVFTGIKKDINSKKCCLYLKKRCFRVGNMLFELPKMLYLCVCFYFYFKNG
jgi:hypothetical protein